MCFSETHDLQVVLFLFKFPERSSVTDRDVICHVVYVCVSPSTCVVCFLRLPPKVQLQGLQHPPFAHGALLTRQALFWWSSYNPGFQSSSREQQPHQKTQTGMALFSLVKCSSSKNMTIADFAALMFFHFFAYKHILSLVADVVWSHFINLKTIFATSKSFLASHSRNDMLARLFQTNEQVSSVRLMTGCSEG